MINEKSISIKLKEKGYPLDHVNEDFDTIAHSMVMFTEGISELKGKAKYVFCNIGDNARIYSILEEVFQQPQENGNTIEIGLIRMSIKNYGSSEKNWIQITQHPTNASIEISYLERKKRIKTLDYDQCNVTSFTNEIIDFIDHVLNKNDIRKEMMDFINQVLTLCCTEILTEYKEDLCSIRDYLIQKQSQVYHPQDDIIKLDDIIENKGKR